MSRDVSANLPTGLRAGAAIAWRLVAIALALYIVARVVSALIALVVPVAIALLLAALLSPAVSRLVRWGLSRALATAIVVVIGLGVVGGMLTFVITRFVDGLPELRAQVSEALVQVDEWLTEGPLNMSDTELQRVLDQAQESIRGNQGEVALTVLDTALTVGLVAGAILLSIFSLVFFLYDGEKIWRFLTRVVPHEHRNRVDVAGRRGFAALGAYVRATVIVAIIDAVAIGVGLAIVGVPLAVPLAALIFLGAFVPILGAFVTGSVAILVALVANGPIAALIVLALLVAVMQLEGNVLQPLLLSRAVRIHPLAVVLGIGVGLSVAGIPGALLSVPLLAVLNASISSLLAPEDSDIPPDEVDVDDPAEAEPGGPVSLIKPAKPEQAEAGR